MMSWSNIGEDTPENIEALFEAGVEPPPLSSRRRVAEYFEAERVGGRVARHVDPDVLARTFLGAIYDFAAMRIMFGSLDTMPMSPEVFTRGLVDTLLRGVEAPRPAKSRRSK